MIVTAHVRKIAAMHVDVNGTRAWFDVDGPALVRFCPMIIAFIRSTTRHESVEV
jgi:hypothetical protein